MPTDFEFKIDKYTVSMAWSSELKDFRAISFESVGSGWSRWYGTLYFFPSGRGDHSESNPHPVGSLRAPRRLLATLDLGDFDGVYAILRSERPVFLRGGGREDNRIEYMELHTNPEPVGEVDTTPGHGIVVGTGDLIAEVEALASMNE
jgi:hypothetical protein